MKNNNNKYSIMTLILLWSGLVIISSMYVTIPLTTVFTDTFHVTANQAAWIGSSFSLCYAIGCLLYGPFSDKYGRKIFLASSISALAIVSFIIGFIDHFSGLVMFRAFEGLIAAAFAPISFVYAAEMFPPEKRLTAVGFISSGLLMASVVGQVFSGAVNHAFGWHAIFTILGAVYLVSSLLVIFFLPKDDLPRAKGSVYAQFKQTKLLFWNRQLMMIYIITFTLLLSLVGMYSVLGNYLTSPEWGLSAQQILWVRAFGIIGMLLSPFAGRIAGKLGNGLMFRGSLVLSVAGLAGLGFSHNLPMLIVTTVLFVAGIALITPISITLINQLAGAAKGSAISFNAFILFLGASTGPSAALYLISRVSYQSAFEWLSLFMAAGFVISLFIKTSPGQTEAMSSVKQVS
ncbi:Predicted arabinose efflux permease, MFS family [Fictibacillus enclensis]|uniref:Major facilitator superfamily (MFS) profile domain-containing protein n=1 Tax=Fictibacillus enclensis TaxID=1017270 RepID=A0A0V8J0C1_9BACL|nr:MFS transporter [Fictibacillus enclensis]KSU80347.1 hypothetical protein AS030_20660 [Fictibacillus enclensis]SCC38326.1 Predicted arabinose efflux permease, MFS family [Fictibacillus enclensis]